MTAPTFSRRLPVLATVAVATLLGAAAGWRAANQATPGLALSP